METSKTNKLFQANKSIDINNSLLNQLLYNRIWLINLTIYDYNNGGI